MAVRTSWSGTINFGMVSVPVGTCGAVQEKDVKFSQFHQVGDDLNPVGRKDYDKVTDETVTRDQITRCYVHDGTPIPVSEDELSALAPEASKTIEIEKFISSDEVDPLYFARHEYAVPAKGAEKPYKLLLSALESTGRSGVARTVRRSKEHTVLVSAHNGAIVLSFLNAADEIRDAADLGIKEPELKAAEVDMAIKLVEALTDEWDPRELVDTHRESVLAMIEAKAAGQPTATVTPIRVEQSTVDLMAALEASVNRAKGA